MSAHTKIASVGAGRRRATSATGPATTAAMFLAAAAAWLGVPNRARAEPLGPDAMARLLRGETLAFEKTMVNDLHRYVGGVTYTIVPGTPEQIAAVFQDAHAYREILPRTKSARFVAPPTSGPAHARGDFFIELRQGTALVEAVYTLHVHKAKAPHTIQFWLDPRMPHGIDDAWGFFRFEPLVVTGEATRPTFLPDGTPAVLLTYGVLADVGPGIVRELFEERVRTVLLSVPELIRAYVQTKSRARTAQKN